jgi:hypothetical protein
MNAVRVSHGRCGRRTVFAGLLLACLAALLGAASALAAVPSNGNLSPRLSELASAAVRSLSPAQQARRLDLPVAGPASLMRRGSRVVAEVRFEQGAAAGADSLRDAGAEVLDVSGRYQTVTVAARPTDLADLGAVAGVAGVTEVLEPIIRGLDCGGAVRSEGDGELNTPAARAGLGVDGSGVTVGIVSDSFDRSPGAATHAANDVFSGDLPGSASPCGSTQPVGVLSDPMSGGTDEGRAMAQIVHDLAPGAAIDFATAAGGQTGFARSIKALAGAGARVIADDAIYPEEPFFQDGPVAVAINEVVAAGVSYFTAAGNDNVTSAGNGVASFEGVFASAGSCPAGVPGSSCDDFDPSGGTDNAYDMTVAPGAEVVLDLQWAEPWGGVQTNLNAYLVDGSGTLLASSTNLNVSETQRPFEALAWKNEGGVTAAVKLAIPRAFGSGSPRLKFVQIGNGANGVVPTPEQVAISSAGFTIGPTIIGHSGAASAISVGAVPFSNSAKPESYSSRGPVVQFFGPVLGSTPAAATGEVVIPKPDLAATDCGATTFFAFKSAGVWRFCGTSAAAPHAAALAALMRQANPGASAAQIRAALLASARPVGAFGPAAVGAGLPDAYAAVNSVALAPAVTITRAPQPLGRERRPLVEFAANRPVAFTCSLDGSAPSPCASPYRAPTKLGDGKHGFLVTATDVGGRVGASPVASFRIDTRAPRTKIAKHPPKLVQTRGRRAKIEFRFHSSERGGKFVCKVDRGRRKFCPSRFAVRLGAGRHEVLVKAVDAAGNVDPTPAVFRFRVKRVG